MTKEKEKAIELRDEFWNVGMMPDVAKESAIFLCDEMLIQYDYILTYLSPEWCKKQIIFWSQVKEELGKL